MVFLRLEGGIQPLGQRAMAEGYRENRSSLGDFGVGCAGGCQETGNRDEGDREVGSIWEKFHGSGGFLKNLVIDQRVKGKSAKSA